MKPFCPCECDCILSSVQRVGPIFFRFDTKAYLIQSNSTSTIGNNLTQTLKWWPLKRFEFFILNRLLPEFSNQTNVFYFSFIRLFSYTTGRVVVQFPKMTNILEGFLIFLWISKVSTDCYFSVFLCNRSTFYRTSTGT